MSDADLLRRAAERVREVAEAATRGPWSAEPTGSEGFHVFGPDGSRAPMRGRARIAACTWQDWEEAEADATHIALWSPPVALAVADWLTAEAERLRKLEILALVGQHVPQAVVVARLILGEQP